MKMKQKSCCEQHAVQDKNTRIKTIIFGHWLNITLNLRMIKSRRSTRLGTTHNKIANLFWGAIISIMQMPFSPFFSRSLILSALLLHHSSTTQFEYFLINVGCRAFDEAN
jgi:hypothetical protein